MRKMIRAIGLGVLVLACLPAPASTVRQMNLEGLVQAADRIFMGRCLESRSERDAALGLDVTLVTMEVIQPFRGTLSRTVTFKLAEASPFHPGEETIVFLHADSRSGLTSPVALGQGKFGVFRDKSGRSWAINDLGNQGLFRALTPDAESRLGERGRRWREERAIPVDELMTMVRALLPAENRKGR